MALSLLKGSQSDLLHWYTWCSFVVTNSVDDSLKFDIRYPAGYIVSGFSNLHDTFVFKIIKPPCIFPMISTVNKSCNIECCVNNMFRINKKMIVSRGLELILSVFRRTIISENVFKIIQPLAPIEI